MSSSVTAIPPPEKPAWAVPYYVKGLALGIPPYLVAIHLWTWLLIVPASLATSGYDFRQAYAAAFMVRTGHAHELYVYDSQKQVQDKLVSRQPVALPFVSPAYEAFFLSPLTVFSFRTAYLLLLAINVAALGVCFVLLRPWMSNLYLIFRWLPIAMFLGFLPIAAALIEGQDSVLLTTLLVGAFVFLTKQRVLSAGVLTGVAFFKFPIVLPIALLFLLWRRWRFLAGFSLSAFLAVCVSVWVTGIPQTKLYVDSLISLAGLRAPTGGLTSYPVNWQMMANVHGFIVGIANGPIPGSWLHVLTILLSAGVLGWTALRGSRVNDTSGLLLLAIPCSVLVGHHTYIHDLSVLLLPMIVLLDSFLPAEALGNNREQAISRSAALIFVAPVVESFAPGHFYFVALAVFLLLLASASAIKSKSKYVLRRGPYEVAGEGD